MQLHERSGTLHAQLRSQTSDLHAAVETVSDLPGSVVTIADYGVLLSTFHAAHGQLEGQLESPRWSTSWDTLGVDVASHRQLHLLEHDLEALGLAAASPTTGDPLVATPEQALGCLYVIQGSSLGRRALFPLLEDTLGNIPAAFFGGARAQLHQWQAVTKALGLVGEDAARRDDVVMGARLAFSVFLAHLNCRTPASTVRR